MSSRTIVHLLRHGEVDNPEGVLYGRLPGYHLSARGRQMAQLAADHLLSRDITVLVSSPLERAQETAAPLVEQTGVALRLDDRLLEAANVFEGRPFTPDRLREPSVWPHLVNPLRPSWGEPYQQIAARMRAVVMAARDAAEGHEAVLVSHQLPVEIVRRSIQGERLWHDPRRRRCNLASLTSVAFVGDQIESVAYVEPACRLYAGASSVPGA
ncbi:hypothetical protein KEM60_00965 [Austwickia sp. TVS 96-490-7B]|uniref:histidine phosphatase family protein n=1 Tax=Austwickia sp. TVS 96-490-7B TaxID=2830843 RepID=UPI001C59F86E|nr:histidine phosphatase family protein [Austwickia sp. TVS 96-490-7B]MBW3084776.1 hypothetical protein [Austwickia sp. TVS 96-490-7B]